MAECIELSGLPIASFFHELVDTKIAPGTAVNNE
jgi:hypothetical protein